MSKLWVSQPRPHICLLWCRICFVQPSLSLGQRSPTSSSKPRGYTCKVLSSFFFSSSSPPPDPDWLSHRQTFLFLCCRLLSWWLISQIFKLLSNKCFHIFVYKCFSVFVLFCLLTPRWVGLKLRQDRLLAFDKLRPLRCLQQIHLVETLL